MFNPEDLKTIANMAMPFGKYKGSKLIELPAAYLEWFARQGFPSGQIGDLLRLTHEIKLNGLEKLVMPLKAH